MGKQKLTLKQRQQKKKEEENKIKKDNRLERDVAVLRSLLNNDFDSIGDQGDQGVRNELNRLRELYPIRAGNTDKLRFLIISIIDIIHDAHGSRVGATTQVAHLPLFKLVVCNIFGINIVLYEFIYTYVVPVTQDVLQKFI